MKELHSISFSPEQKNRFVCTDLSFGDNGPYSLSCDGSETVGLIGVSGIGKSLFLRALADLDSHSGRVTLGNWNCSDVSAPVWRSRVALIPSESRWWFHDVNSHMTNTGSGEELNSLLVSLGFGEDVLNWQVSRLSTGEKQRLSLVRVLVRRPEMLLLDELGSSLDRDNCEMLEAAVRKYQKLHHAPVLWVSHDKEQLQRIADRLVVIHQDRLEEGSLTTGETT